MFGRKIKKLKSKINDLNKEVDWFSKINQEKIKKIDNLTRSNAVLKEKVNTLDTYVQQRDEHIRYLQAKN
jgi:chromosome segregation ATPase